MATNTLLAKNTESVDMAEQFHRYFNILPANTTDLKEKIYRMRYDVYCEEFHYEPSETYPDAMERDEYDAYAWHALVVHRSTGQPAGCTRIVPAGHGNINTPMPFERYCRESLDMEYLDKLNLPRSTMCEASRLAVHTNFRRRHGESATRYGHIQSLGIGPEEQRIFPLIVVAISLATTALTELTGRTNMFAMMEPFLPRILRHIGYDFTQIGKQVNYHGRRAAYMVGTESVLKGLKPEYRKFYQSIRDTIAISMHDSGEPVPASAILLQDSHSR